MECPYCEDTRPRPGDRYTGGCWLCANASQAPTGVQSKADADARAAADAATNIADDLARALRALLAATNRGQAVPADPLNPTHDPIYAAATAALNAYYRARIAP